MSDAIREAFEALDRVGNYVSVPYEMMAQFADDLDTVKAALQSQTATAVPEGVDFDLVSAILEDYASLQICGVIPCANRYSASDANEQAELLDALSAAPQTDHIADAGKVVAELDRIRGLIAQAPIDSLDTGHNDGSCPPWPIRDEIVDGLSKIIRALPATPSAPEEETAKVVQGEPVAVLRCSFDETGCVKDHWLDWKVGAEDMKDLMPLYTHPAKSEGERSK